MYGEKKTVLTMAADTIRRLQDIYGEINGTERGVTFDAEQTANLFSLLGELREMRKKLILQYELHYIFFTCDRPRKKIES